MFELVFLGTSASRPTATRGLPALMVLHGRERYLVDCGEGTQRPLVRAGLGFRRLGRVFLTHEHLDHVLGLGGLITALAELPDAHELTIHAGDRALALAERFVREVVLPETDAHLGLRFEALHAGRAIEAPHLVITPVPVVHRGGDSFGFLFEEPAVRHLDAARAAALGLEEGPARHALQHGEPVRRPDGTVVAPEAVLGPARPGTRLLVIGDAAETAALRAPAEGVDALVIEATFLEEKRDLARRTGHLTAREAALLAHDAGARRLILTHISARYEGPELLAEARAVFPSTELASDLARFRVRREERSAG
jgi:ribonuclease Z